MSIEAPDLLRTMTAPRALLSQTVADLSPSETADKLLDWSLAKSALRLDRMIALGIMAGLFIGFGGIFFTTVMIETPLGHGPTRLLGGIAFSMGLLLVCMTGAELSTGNCMIAAAWAEARLSTRATWRILGLSYAANAAGALALAGLMLASGLMHGPHGATAARIAEAKLAVPFGQTLVRAILCNVLVCLAVWLIQATRTLPAKLLGFCLPISAFVAIGFEHSIANLYLIPVGLAAGAQGSLWDATLNIAAATAGNLIGGCAVALAIWCAHLRRPGQRLPSGRGGARGD